MEIVKAGPEDLEMILKLQYLAFQVEARIWQNYQLKPLVETLAEIRQEYDAGPVLKAVLDDGTLVGSVRGYVEDGTLYILKLIVHPDFQGQGIGTALVRAIEELHPGLRYELYTSCRSERNLRLYEKLGYRRYREEVVSPIFTFIHLEKIPVS